MMTYTIGYQGPLKATYPSWQGCKYNVLVEWETGEKTYEPLSVLAAYNPGTYVTNAKENDLLHADGWKRFRNLAKRDKHNLSSLASPKGEMKSSFCWASLLNSPTASTLCFGGPMLGKLNQIKLLCSPTSSTLCDPTLPKPNQETEFCVTKHNPICDSVAHTGTTFSVPISSSHTNRVSHCHSNLMTTPSSRKILDKFKTEVTKDPIHHNGKNGEHFYGENFIYEYTIKSISSQTNTWASFMHSASQTNTWASFLHSGTVYEQHSTMGPAPQKLTGVIPKQKLQKNGLSLMEVDWGGKLKANSVVD